MNTYLFYQKTCDGIHNVMLVAANSKDEAIDIALDEDNVCNIVKYVPRCYEIPELTPNVENPCIIRYISY